MKRIAKNTISVEAGKYAAPGEEIDLTKAQEKQLEAAGALQDKNAKSKAAPAAPVKPAAAALSAAIVKAAAGLDPETEDAWTADGKPSIHALEKTLGYPVSPRERDGAWKDGSGGDGGGGSGLEV